ncbi:MAG: hypothetical protein AAFN13_10245, partial [Bacteroidota bacterium]
MNVHKPRRRACIVSLPADCGAVLSALDAIEADGNAVPCTRKVKGHLESSQAGNPQGLGIEGVAETAHNLYIVDYTVLIDFDGDENPPAHILLNVRIVALGNQRVYSTNQRGRRREVANDLLGRGVRRNRLLGEDARCGEEPHETPRPYPQPPTPPHRSARARVWAWSLVWLLATPCVLAQEP